MLMKLSVFVIVGLFALPLGLGASAAAQDSEKVESAKIEENASENFTGKLAIGNTSERNCKVKMLPGEIVVEFESEKIRIPLKNILSARSDLWSQYFSDFYLSYLGASPSSVENRTNFLHIWARDPRNQKRYSQQRQRMRDLEIYSLKSMQLPSNEDALALQIRSDSMIAPDPLSIDKLLKSKICIRCNLKLANLASADLKGANLEGVDLEGANLEGANLENAYLVGANLSHANLKNTKLSGAKLTRATLKEANLDAADLRAIHLQGANLQAATLRGANLRANGLKKTDLRFVNLIQANLDNSYLSGIDLELANLQGASLKNVYLDTLFTTVGAGNGTIRMNYVVRLFGADLSDANLTGANVTGTDLSRAKLCKTIMPSGSLSEEGCK
jgi:uncharacterized protein YjbI with pentapeptide repeats